MKVKIDVESLRKIEQALKGIKDNVKPIQARAINKTTAGGRTDMTRIVTADLNLLVGHVRDSIKIRTASASSLYGYTRRTGKPISLAKFKGVKQKAKGVSVKVKKTGKPALLKHAFIAKMKSGHVGVFWREKGIMGRAAKRMPWAQKKLAMYKYRLKIKELSGPRVEDILNANILEIETKAGERLVVEADRLIKYELSKL